MTVRELIDELSKFDPDRQVRVTCLAESTGTVRQGDVENAPVDFISDNGCANGYKEPTIHISLFDED